MIVGISGFAGSGKDTLADFLVPHGFQKISLADPLKKICKDVFDFSDQQLWGPSEYRNLPDKRYRREHSLVGNTCICCGQKHQYTHEFQPCYLTPRYALQLLGTEWGRHCYRHIWVDYVVKMAAHYPNVVVPDVRYLNEINRLQSEGAKVVRIVRSSSNPRTGMSHHSSEVEQSQIDDNRFDFVIKNEGTLEDLRSASHDLLVFLLNLHS